MDLVTIGYVTVAGIFGGLVGATLIALIRSIRKPKPSVGGWDVVTFIVSFCVCGLISAVVTYLLLR